MPNHKEAQESIEQATPDVFVPKPKGHMASKKMLGLLGLAPIIALCALVIALYTRFSVHELKNEFLEALAALSTEINQQKEARTQEHSLKEQINRLKGKQNELNQALLQLAQQLHTADLNKANQEQKWILLKARYYLELAQINAHWSPESQSTIILLEASDALLAKVHAPEIFKIRQILAHNIAALKNKPPIDSAGLLSQLDACQNNVAHLKIKSNEPLHFNASAPLVPTSSTWQAALRNALSSLDKLVLIRRNDERVQPLLSPVFEAALKENLRLNLQEAQWAVLRENQEAYQWALKQAIGTIKRGFNQQEKETLTLLKQVMQLQKINLTVSSAEENQALPLLNQLIAQEALTLSDKGEPK